MDDISTPRLNLRLLTQDEAARILEDSPGADDAWADGFPTEDDQDGVRGYHSHLSEGGAPTPFGCYVIEVRSDGASIGTIGFYGPPDAEGRVTVGYGLVPHSWGNGYATEALTAIVGLCRAHADVRLMRADTEHANAASQRVLAKAGFATVRQDPDLVYYELAVANPPPPVPAS